MFLYVCKRCHCWQDMSLADAVSKAAEALVAALRQTLQTAEVTPAEPQAVQCPNGCGEMTFINASDKLSLVDENEQGMQSLLARAVLAVVEKADSAVMRVNEDEIDVVQSTALSEIASLCRSELGKADTPRVKAMRIGSFIVTDLSEEEQEKPEKGKEEYGSHG